MTTKVRQLAQKILPQKKSGGVSPHIERFKSERHIVNEPFYFEGTNGKGVLLLHGWSSTPYEMRALAERLHDEGYSVYAPLLTGHGTQAEDLEGVPWQEWKRDAREAYEELRAKCNHVYVGGISLGGTLALHVARTHGDAAGVILMSTPYWLRYERLGYYLSHLMKRIRTYKKKYYPKSIGSNDVCMTQLISYQHYPIGSAHEVFYAVKSILHHLAHVTQPVLIIQSYNDHLVSHKSVDAFEGALGSNNITRHMLRDAYHNFIGDTKNNHIFEDIISFLDRSDTVKS